MKTQTKARLAGLILLLTGVFTASAEAALPLVTLPPPAESLPEEMQTPDIRRVYQLGDSGADVYAFKERIQYLGYFRQGASLSDRVSETTLERVNQLLADQGMEPVESITMEIQEMILTQDDLAICPTPTPSPSPKPFVMPQKFPALPALDAEGFLAEPEGEFVYADDADGLWYYLSHDLYVNIRRYNDQQERNIWFETEVKTRGDEGLRSFLANPITVYRTPVELARDHSAVVAFTDDFFTKRSYGVVVRDGEIYRNYIRSSAKSYPLGDTLAVFADGSMRAYDVKEYLAEDLLALGAVHVISFGPWLLHNGEINPRVSGDTYMHYHEPRSALGMIAPGHYVVITVDGRYEGARGAYFSWVASRMKAIGVTEALNLDGGGTTALVFMGTQISRVSSAQPDGKSTRKVSSLLGFGVSALALE